MIHVITAGNRSLYASELAQHHLIRHEIFVKERGWSALDRPDGRELDGYDTDETIYLLALDEGRVVGGHRLFPTTRPHMLSEVFPALVAQKVPSAPDVYEWSRFFIVRERRSGRTYLRLMAAVQQLCLEEGISSITAVIEMWWLPRFHEAGFVVHPLGLPQPVEGVATAAVMIEIREESLARVRQLGDLPASVLVRRGDSPPLVRRDGYRLPVQ
ncbi:acyl-homoserine-lactone synthase [Chelatococcus sp. SYSU_G07232]|uniref:Acyl-homoserine-lactone synthase n=1 Tax=Chelatococcus albus TaxID=3047466 RepID=A0ABT7AG02_9HYPH|nr:acyl-homoserine-lactone synthase [Chelatococcus sp. SYSU_G07232]MDJ1157571.1 acyl-homoserine-lactone synthase [Chelatococcus sp. SYSU_G07232]